MHKSKEERLVQKLNSATALIQRRDNATRSYRYRMPKFSAAVPKWNEGMVLVLQVSIDNL
jgi:hypothetical protein